MKVETIRSRMHAPRWACAAFLFSLAAGFLPAQQNPQTPADSGVVIRSETRVVLVDAVVTDKKGNYLRDLTAKDFKVWEDNKEQRITSFSFEADPASPTVSQPRYIVLFFDNSTMDFAAQAQARDAAAKFIDSNAGPNRLMAIVNYGGSLQVAQNFSSDAERLKGVVKGIKFSSISPNERGTVPLSRVAADFGVRDVILAIRSLAKNLAAVPGRKSLILFTAGFPVSPEILPEVTATISACNKSNVAVYPIDVRGLTTPNLGPPARGPLGVLTFPSLPDTGASEFVSGESPRPPAPSYFRNAAFVSTSLAFFSPAQVRAPGGGPGTPTPPSTPRLPGTGPPPVRPAPTSPTPTPTTPTRGNGNTGPNPTYPVNRNSPMYPNRNNPYNQPRILIPTFPDSPVTNQNIMYLLAEGTGGFVIVNTNDLAGGLEKIGKELNEFYLVGYTPPESEEGSCHTLRVKVEHAASVRARTGYCNTKPKDYLAQTPIEKVLESRAAGAQAGNVAASIQAPYFFTSENVARVDVAMEISPDLFEFDKEKGKFRAIMSVLGVATRPDGTVGARFSDSVKLEFDDKKQVEAFKERRYHYENQFDIASGQYTLKVVFSSGKQNFGKMETKLSVDPYDANKFAISPVAFSTRIQKMSQMDLSMDTALMEDRMPLVSQGYQVIPAGTNKFKATDKAVMYLEVYEPLLVTPDPAKPVAVALQIRVLDGTNGQQKSDSGLFRLVLPEKGGRPAIPVGMQVPIASLAPGNYRLELSALDTSGAAVKRLTDFVIE